MVPLLARVLNQLGRSSEVLKAWRATQLTSPEARLALQLELGEAEVHAGTLKAARETFAAALQARPGIRRPLQVWQWSRFREDRTAEAKRLAEEAIQSDPKSPRAHVLLGELYNRLGDREQARAALRRALRSSPRFLSAMGMLDCPDHGRWGLEGSEGPDSGGKPGWSTRFAHRVPRGDIALRDGKM